MRVVVGTVAKMAALKEEQCYGLSCGRVSNGSNVSVFHVKLTDSALRAFEGYQSTKVNGSLFFGTVTCLVLRLESVTGRVRSGLPRCVSLPLPPSCCDIRTQQAG